MTDSVIRRLIIIGTCAHLIRAVENSSGLVVVEREEVDMFAEQIAQHNGLSIDKAWIDECKPEVEQLDELKPSMNFYQGKLHRRKKGGKVSFK